MAIKKEDKLGILAIIGLGILAYFGLKKEEEPPVTPIPPPPPGMFTVTVKADPVSGGSVAIEPDKDYYNKYEAVVLGADASESYSFSHWTNVIGVVLTHSSRIHTVIVRNEIFTAHFRKEAPPLPSYTKIVGWSGHPDSAKVGTIITIKATIKNYSEQSLVAKVEGELLGYPISRAEPFTIATRELQEVTMLSFGMPNRDIVVTISSSHQEDTAWIEDDSIPIEILLER